MRNRRAAGHHIGVEAVVWVARQFEQAAGPPEQRIEPLARAVVGEACAIVGALEREDRLQLPAELERDFSSDLVGAVGDRRDEPQPRFAGCEAVALGIQKLAARLLDPQEDVANALAQDRYAVLRQDVGAMAGDPHRKDERHRRRTRPLQPNAHVTLCQLKLISR